MAQVELNIINTVDLNDKYEIILDWLHKWQDQLDFISDDEGCGCCVNLWTVRGEEQLVRNIMMGLPEQVRNLPMPVN